MTKRDHEKDPFTVHGDRHTHGDGEPHARTKLPAVGEKITHESLGIEKPGLKKAEPPAPPPKPKPADLVAKWKGLAADQHVPSEHRQVYGLCAAALAEALKA